MNTWSYRLTISPREQIAFRLQLNPQVSIVIVLIVCILSSCPNAIQGSPSRILDWQLSLRAQRANNKKRIQPPKRLPLSKPLGRIRFQLYDNHLIFLQVRINGSEPLWFMLDSGGTKTLINERRAQALALTLQGKVASEAAGGPFEAREIEGVSLGLASVELPKLTVVTAPLESLEFVFGRTIDGIIGYDFFSRFVVEIDYAARTISVYDPQTYKYAGHGERIQIKLEEAIPHVSARIVQVDQEPMEGDFAIDSGYNGALLLNSPFVRTNQLLQVTHKTIPAPSLGIGGETNLRLGRVKSLEIGKFTIRNLIAGFSMCVKGSNANPDYAGRIGGELLRRFKVVFDYTHEWMMLEPNGHFWEPFGENMSGLSLISVGPGFETFKVVRVLEGSPAARAGLREGDILAAVDGKPATKFTLERVRQMFRQSGRRYLLSVKRGAKSLSVMITLKQLI